MQALGKASDILNGIIKTPDFGYAYEYQVLVDVLHGNHSSRLIKLRSGRTERRV